MDTGTVILIRLPYYCIPYSHIPIPVPVLQYASKTVPVLVTPTGSFRWVSGSADNTVMILVQSIDSFTDGYLAIIPYHSSLAPGGKFWNIRCDPAMNTAHLGPGASRISRISTTFDTHCTHH